MRLTATTEPNTFARSERPRDFRGGGGCSNVSGRSSRLAQGHHYLNCAYLAPLARVVEAASQEALHRLRDPSTIGVDAFFADVDRIRTLFAKLVHAPERRLGCGRAIGFLRCGDRHPEPEPPTRAGSRGGWKRVSGRGAPLAPRGTRVGRAHRDGDRPSGLAHRCSNTRLAAKIAAPGGVMPCARQSRLTRQR